MKKKFIAVYALIGVLALGSTTLTSCVDDNESPSVTAIRDAKAQSLQALANLTQAQADAEKIVSEAEARLTAAKAALKEAEAQLAQQKADSVKAVMDISIESAKQAAQAELYRQQGIVAEAQAQLIASLDAVDQATKQKIETLLANADALMNGGEYFTYQLVKDDPNTEEVESGWQWKSETIDKSITQLQLDKLNIQAEQVKAEYGLADVKEAIAETITKKDNEIAQYKAQIEAYTALKEASTREEVEAQYEQAKTDLITLEKSRNEKYELANVKYIDVANIFDWGYIGTAYAPKGTLFNTALLQALNASNEEYITWDDDEGHHSEINPLYNIGLYDKYNCSYGGNNYNVAKYLKSENLEPKLYEYQTSDNTTGTYLYYYLGGFGVYDAIGVKNFTEVDTEALTADITKVSRDIDVQKNSIAEGKKLLEEYKKQQADAIKTAEENVKNADDTYKKEPSQSNRDALEQAESSLDAINQDIEDYEQRNVTDKEDALETMNEALEVLNNIQTLLTGTDNALTAYQTEYANYVKAQDAYAAAWVEYLKINYTYNVTKTLVTTLKPYVDNENWDGSDTNDWLTDWDAEIKECNNKIEKAEIAKATATGKYDILESAEGDPKSKEKVTEEVMNWYIEKLAQDLAAVEAQLNYYNSLYKSCMDQANELIQNGAALPDTPSTDTPAEGEGEETPAE